MTRPKSETPANKKSTRPALKAIAPEAEPEELVTCFMSGQTVPRSQAVLVKIGPGQRVWMLPDYCNDERDRRA